MIPVLLQCAADLKNTKNCLTQHRSKAVSFAKHIMSSATKPWECQRNSWEGPPFPNYLGGDGGALPLTSRRMHKLDAIRATHLLANVHATGHEKTADGGGGGGPPVFLWEGSPFLSSPNNIVHIYLVIVSVTYEESNIF